MDPEGYYEDLPFWCDKCLDEENRDEEEEGYELQFLLPICNSLEWVYADMKEVIVIRSGLSRINGK